MEKDRFTEHAQNLQGCEKCNLRKAVGNLGMPIGCEICAIALKLNMLYYCYMFIKLSNSTRRTKLLLYREVYN